MPWHQDHHQPRTRPCRSSPMHLTSLALCSTGNQAEGLTLGNCHTHTHPPPPKLHSPLGPAHLQAPFRFPVPFIAGPPLPTWPPALLAPALQPKLTPSRPPATVTGPLRCPLSLEGSLISLPHPANGASWTPLLVPAGPPRSPPPTPLEGSPAAVHSPYLQCSWTTSRLARGFREIRHFSTVFSNEGSERNTPRKD